jgi:polar amino acid transport system substrate-binding protein
MKKIKKILCWMIVMFSTIIISAYAEELRIWGLSEPPGNFMNEHGEFVGLSVDIVREIQQRVGNTDKIEMLPWRRIYKTALKKPNIVFFSVARTLKREDKFHWITLMMRKPWAFYAKKGSGLQIKSLDDAKKVRAIGVMAGGIRDTWLQQQGFTNIDRVSSHELNVAKLERRRVQIIFYSPQGMAHTCRELNYDFNTFEIVLVPHSSVSYLAMSRNGTSEEIVKQWQETAQQIKDDGTFDKLAEKWAKYTREKGGVEAEVKDGALNFWKE